MAQLRRSRVSHFGSRARTIGVLSAPFVLAVLLVGPGMVQRAEGCSGAYSKWIELTWAPDDTAPTDAVVVLVGKTENPSEPESVEINVMDSVGASVPGKTWYRRLGEGGASFGHAAFFQPDAPLEPDASYTVSWSTPITGRSGLGKLTTVSTPGAKPQAPKVEAKLERRHALVGSDVSCLAEYPVGCALTKSFRSREVMAPSMVLTVTQPTSATSVYSLTYAEPVTGGLALETWPVQLVQAGPTGSGTITVTFEAEMPEYCVLVRTRDLTDDSLTSFSKVCLPSSGDPTPDSTPLLDAELLGCQGPPDAPELVARWCQLRPGASECPPASPDAGSAQASESDSSSGLCSLSPARRSGGPAAFGFTLGLAVLGALGRRARRKRRSGRNRGEDGC